MARTFRREGPSGVVRAALHTLRARWQLRKVSTLGSARVRGHVHVLNHGTIQIADRVLMEGTSVRIELVARGGTLTIGEGTYLNYGTSISAKNRVTIGRNCAIGQYSIIMDSDYHSPANHRDEGPAEAITIEDDVWLGARVIVLRGARIGRGAVIGANSLVRGEIPPYTLAVGSPARVVKHLRESNG